MSHGASFDWTKIRSELDSADWEPSDDDVTIEVRRVWLGTIFGLTPSGKFYMPFACSNVAGDCPVCGGSGARKLRTGKRARARAKRRAHDFAKGSIARHGGPAHRAYLARVYPMREAAHRAYSLTCCACDGLGSISAARDERWNEALEKHAEAIGAFVDYCDDSIFIAESREKPDDVESCPVCGSDDLEHDTPEGACCADCGCVLSETEVQS